MARILAVDDEPDLRTAIERILTRRGHEVTAAGGVTEALRLLNSLDPDLLLTDVRMPDGTGADIAGEVRRRSPGTPVLFVSGYPREHVEMQGIVGDGEEVLEKPFSPAQLADAVEHAIDGR